MLQLERSTTQWQHCAACGGRNDLHAAACEFCARLLDAAPRNGAGATVAAALRRYTSPAVLLAILIGTIILVGALAFFRVLAIGAVAEHFAMLQGIT